MLLMVIIMGLNELLMFLKDMKNLDMFNYRMSGGAKLVNYVNYYKLKEVIKLKCSKNLIKNIRLNILLK